VKIRRTKRSIDLRNLPLDGFDMFLLTRLESTLALSELLDIAPCDHDETLRRLHQLVGFQLVEVSGAKGEKLPAPKPVLAKKPLQITIGAEHPDFDDEDTGTLRPPPKKRRANPAFSRTLSEDDATTLRPPSPLAVKDMMREAEKTTVQRVVKRSSGVMEKKPANVEFETPRTAVTADGRPVRDGSVFARTTLVDDDAEERARSIR
jgi:hypothetical protein